jgi:hypothetical protein
MSKLSDEQKAFIENVDQGQSVLVYFQHSKPMIAIGLNENLFERIEAEFLKDYINRDPLNVKGAFVHSPGEFELDDNINFKNYLLDSREIFACTKIENSNDLEKLLEDYYQ